MAIASFAPSASIQLNITQQTSNVVLPTAGSPTIAYVTNQGNNISFFVLGDSSTKAQPGLSMVILPGTTSLPITIGSNTYIAGVTLQGLSALNITVGS